MPSRKILFLAPAQAVTRIFPQLKEDGYEAGLAENLPGALGYIKKSAPDMIFSRPRLPGYRVEDLLAEAARDPSFPPVVVFTDQGAAEEAQRLLELGARDYWLEPLVWDKIAAVLPLADPLPAAADKTRAASSPAALKGVEIIGKHPAIARVLALAKQVARSKATVLISGDSGTGKEMVARYVHLNSERADKSFIAINCAALPEHLLESELFGHEKGSFTGAINRKLGKFELADKGTLFLDEISEMDLGLQAKLLRVLQEGELDRVGGVETIKVDVRVLATTNRNLHEWVETGKFRQDLFFRLNVIPLRLPALRERGEDTLVLARYFIEKFRRQYTLPPLSLSQEAIDWLTAYDWPGNVRELQNLMERAVLLAGGGLIQKAHFLLDEAFWPEETAPAGADEPVAVPVPLRGDALEQFMGGGVMTLHEMERIMIMRGLEQTLGNRTQAAELLGISVRTLRNKLNEYRSLGMEIP